MICSLLFAVAFLLASGMIAWFLCKDDDEPWHEQREE
jgi:hypothetical protein